MKHHGIVVPNRTAIRVASLVSAVTWLACTTADHPTAPPSAQVVASAVSSDACGATCALFVSNAPLWSALANPDSAGVPVDLATVVLVGASGDSVVLRLVADSTVTGAIPTDELIGVATPGAVTAVPLRSLLSGAVVLRLSSSDTVMVHYSMNRSLPRVPEGATTLIQETSAHVASAETPWVPTGGGASLRAPAMASVTDPCSGNQPVNAGGTYCGNSVLFTPYAPADAFLAAGAKIQSDVGHGVSHQITVTFSSPVASVTVTAYDPTFNGNQMAAFDPAGASQGVAAFPGNGIPGVLTTQTRTLSGAISRVVLTPAPLDYLAYSMAVTFASPVSVTVSSAAGPNPGGSFIVRTPENVIRLEARVTPASLAPLVEWEVVPLNDSTIPPGAVTPGASSSFVVPAANRRQSRWPVVGRVNHPPLTAAQKASDLTKKSLGYRITAKVTANAQTVRSQSVTVQQDEIDTMREEYVEFGQQRVLGRTEFGTFGDPLRNLTADYTLWPSGPRLVEKMPIMQQLAVRRFGRPITVMSGYRNPVHHFLHAGATAVNSQHLYGLATDWEIVAAASRPAGFSVREYFDEIKKLSRSPTVDGCWEPDSVIIRTSSRIPADRSLNHAHTDWRAMSLCAPTWQ
jgi:uncharacterized protein YcbK (DUF882 family)